jgi:hypothetical protein
MVNAISAVRHKEMGLKLASKSLRDNVYSKETCMKIVSIEELFLLLFDDAKKLDTAEDTIAR